MGNIHPEDTADLVFGLSYNKAEFDKYNNIIVVLTNGYEKPGLSENPNLFVSSYLGYQRGYAAAQLYHSAKLNGDTPLVIISGGKVKIGDEIDPPSLSEIMSYELIDQFNVDPGDILQESRSRDTLENAQYVTKILKSIGKKNITVVTSDNHIKRARYLFEHTSPDILSKYISAEYVISQKFPAFVEKTFREKEHIIDKGLEYVLYSIYRLPGGIGIQLINWLANKNRNTHTHRK